MSPAEPAARRRAAERRGARSETLAALFLRLKGYRLLARRYRTPVGEIDLIMRRGGRIAFIEVKQRASREAALAAVTPAARRRIARAAEAWLAAHPDAAGMDCSLDVVALVPWRMPLHLANAFDAPRR